MIIKENIELINDTLNRSYTNLQELVYEEEIELLHWAIKKGHGRYWTCFRILDKRGEI